MDNNTNNTDASDKLIENQDLLDILAADMTEDSKSELEKALSDDTSTDPIDDEEDEATKRMEELKALANQLGDSPVDLSNAGSGDLDTDLSRWFNGETKMPSNELNAYVANVPIKFDYGLTRQTLSNFNMMGTLNKFMSSSFDLLFDESAAMTLAPDELEDRVKLAFTMYKELASINQRTVMSLKDFKLKSGGTDDEVDKISLLISSIPSDKLKALLEELNTK